jgi:hypothetical protein
VRHDERGTAEERQRRDHHPPVADRDELLDAGARLLLLAESSSIHRSSDRTWPVGRGNEVRELAARRLDPRRASHRLPLRGRRVGEDGGTAASCRHPPGGRRLGATPGRASRRAFRRTGCHASSRTSMRAGARSAQT